MKTSPVEGEDVRFPNTVLGPVVGVPERTIALPTKVGAVAEEGNSKYPYEMGK